MRRLDLLLDNDTMRAMLTSPATRFTFDDALDSGKIVIINNSKERLGDQGSEFFGRFFIAQLLATAQRRSSRPQSQKKPAFCYIDECQNVIYRDEKIPTILDECRSQRIALILSHQRTTQIKDENVLSALSNCAIRFANSDAEAKRLAASLRTSQEFLESLTRGTFAAYIRDRTKNAIAIDVMKPDFPLDDKLDRDEQERLRQAMMARYGRQAPTPNRAPQEPAKGQAPERPKKNKRWDPLP